MVKLLEGDPGDWCGAVRDPEGRRERDRGLHPDQQQHPGAGVYPRGPTAPTSAAWWSTARWWPPCAARPSRGVSLQPAPGRRGLGHQDHPGGERATAVQAAKIMGLDVAGGGHSAQRPRPLVLEVNSSPACRVGGRLRQGRGGQDHRVSGAQGEPQAQAGGMSPKRVSDR